MELARHSLFSPLIRWLVGSFTALLLTLPALEGFGATPLAVSKDQGQHRSLSLEERVAARKAIEEVFWRHRIWPKENPGPKPALEKVLPDSAIRAKVTDYLKKSNALEKLWSRPITAAQLQAEMDRMAKNSRQPGVLREIFAALHDDPFMIAESLARPTLADRFLHNAYSTDALIHRAARGRAEEDLARFGAPGQMREMRGDYREKTWIRAESDSLEELSNQDHLSSAQFGALVEGLKERLLIPGDPALSSEELPIGKIGPLRETEDSFSVTAILSRGTDSIRIASVTWSKTPFEVWWKQAIKGLEDSVSLPASAYESVSLESAGCTDDTWRPTGESTPAPRTLHTAVWTGSEMIVWGGYMGSGAGSGPTRSGSRYNPATDSWATTFNDNNPSHVPAATSDHVAVWTGSKMIIWSRGTGGIYDPLTDTWDLDMGTPSANPQGGSGATAVWTGSEMIFWGGTGSGLLGTGARFNPTTKTWTATSTGVNVPTSRHHHSAVWTGTEMIVWGGRDRINRTLFNTGGRYDPATNSWTPTGIGTGVPTARDEHTAVWTGSEMIVWGGKQTSPLDTGARYDPSLDSWSAIPADANTPSPRYQHTAVWTGTQMIIWGGATATGPTNTGSRYDASTGTWAPTLAGGPTPPQARAGHTAIWTGTEMIIWGGAEAFSGFSWGTGGRYNPQTDSWFPTAIVLSAGPRQQHSAIWTGAEMIIWGGADPIFNTAIGSGRSFQAATAAWESVSQVQGLEPRSRHTAVWTGTEMIVWGGWNGSEISTGGRYNPSPGVWTLTSNEGSVPGPRTGHTAVWTGTEMIIWGGSKAGGSRYDPATNTWISVSNASAPSPRAYHTAVWTGSEMIVWGGNNGSTPVGSGSRYDPSTDGWSPITSTDAPSPRVSHSAVWTGSEMIVWGGNNGSTPFLETGGRYDPAADAWVSTSSSPLGPRAGHTAIWTGHEMVVFGGASEPGVLALFHARYNPSTDSWSPISNQSSVSLPRAGHVALWTGEEMIVYGGSESQNGARYCRLCPALYTYYADQDGDTFGDPDRPGTSCDATPPASYASDASDCSDTDATAWASAAEVAGLQVGSTSPTEVTWDSQGLQAGSGTAYDVAGGYIFLFTGFLDFAAGSCLQGGGSNSFTDFASDPGPGAARWYLARAHNSCGIGTYGTGSFGLDRDGSIPACP